MTPSAYPPPPDKTCTYCDRNLKYTPDSKEPWAKHFAPFHLGPCCASTWIRDCFKNEGVDTRAVARYGLTGGFWDYAERVFADGPDSGVGRWFIRTYL